MICRPVLTAGASRLSLTAPAISAIDTFT